MNKNQPDPPKQIVNFPKGQYKNNLVKEIMAQQVYIEARTFRIQVYIFIEFSRYYYDGNYKLTYEEVANLFNVTIPIVKRAYSNAKKDLDETTKPNGRPFSLSKDQIQKLSEWIKSLEEPPQIRKVKTFIANEVGEELDNKTYKNALFKAGLKTEFAEAIDADRYYCKPSSIEYYYSMLESYFHTYNIPCSFVFNVDEEGHDEYVDTKKKELLVVPQDNTKRLQFPVERKDEHTTFVACICADGTYLKPLIVVKRKTIEARILRTSLCGMIKIEHEETGYVNSEVFNAWINKVFIPAVTSRRLEYNYTGPAVLIIDGCPSHYTEELFDACNSHNIKIFFIPPHSSNQTQMLDLALFHSHKEKVRNARLFEIDDDDLLIEKVKMLFDSFQQAASYKTITKAFETAGAVFDPPGPNDCGPIVRFSIDFPTQITHLPRTKKVIAEIREKRKGKSETEIRVNLKDLDLSTYWQNQNIQKVIKKMPKIIDYTEFKDPFHRLLIAQVPLNSQDLDHLRENDQELNEKKEIKKGRPKKEEKEKITETYSSDFTFMQKLNFELKSLGLDL